MTSGGRARAGPGGREWPPPANLVPPSVTPCHPPPTNPPSPGDRSLPRPAADASPVSFSFHARAQTEADITFTFDVKDSGYTSFFYNTTSAPGARFSVVSAVMRNATDELFVRLHLGGAIDPAGTTAEVVEQGARMRFAKVSPGVWPDAIHFATQTPLEASVPVEVQGQTLQVKAKEYDNFQDKTLQALATVEGLESVAQEDLDRVGQLLGRQFDQTTPVCAEKGFCTCRDPYVFDGRRCVSVRAWEAPESRIVSRSHIVMSNEKGERVLIDAQDMLGMNNTVFGDLFNRYQTKVAEQPSWPYMVYAQTFKAKKILAIGAGLNHFEPMIMVREGAFVTFVDPEAENLELMERLANATAVPRGMVQYVRYEGLESLDALATDYDAVLILDSLSKAPTQVGRDLLASKCPMRGWPGRSPHRRSAGAGRLTVSSPTPCAGPGRRVRRRAAPAAAGWALGPGGPLKEPLQPAQRPELPGARGAVRQVRTRERAPSGRLL